MTPTFPYDPEAACEFLKDRDRRLGKVIKAYGSCGVLSRTSMTPFAALIRSIVYQ
ncbi:MAG: hypothetical protein VX910_08930 [Candidatus Latescibacterota bacterium]|nr:hypothetical protein [Candidatus Latescibacterota bacterium]